MVQAREKWGDKNGGRNYAVFEAPGRYDLDIKDPTHTMVFYDGETNKTYIVSRNFPTSTTKDELGIHSETIAMNEIELNTNEGRIGWQNIQGIYSEREPCISCSNYIKQYLGHAEVFYSFNYQFEALGKTAGDAARAVTRKALQTAINSIPKLKCLP